MGRPSCPANVLGITRTPPDPCSLLYFFIFCGPVLRSSHGLDYFRFARDSVAIRGSAFFRAPNLGAFTIRGSSFLFQGVSEYRLAAKRNMEAEEEQSKWNE